MAAVDDFGETALHGAAGDCRKEGGGGEGEQGQGQGERGQRQGMQGAGSRYGGAGRREADTNQEGRAHGDGCRHIGAKE